MLFIAFGFYCDVEKSLGITILERRYTLRSHPKESDRCQIGFLALCLLESKETINNSLFVYNRVWLIFRWIRDYKISQFISFSIGKRERAVNRYFTRDRPDINLLSNPFQACNLLAPHIFLENREKEREGGGEKRNSRFKAKKKAGKLCGSLESLKWWLLFDPIG